MLMKTENSVLTTWPSKGRGRRAMFDSVGPSQRRGRSMTRKLDYLVFDADNHMYESTDAFTKYLPEEYAGVIKYVDVNGRTKIAIKNKISDYIPNPTFTKVAPPGAQELEFRLKNPSSKTRSGDIAVAPPPRYIESPAAFFEPEARLRMMDDLN